MSKKEKHTLNPSEMNLLLALLHSRKKQSNKIFDKKDNCFTNKSFRQIAELTDKSKSSLQRLFSKLKSENLIRTVVNVKGEKVRMLKPAFQCFTKNKYDTYFNNAMFHLGSHKKACEWAIKCREDYTLYDYTNFKPTEVINFKTGEVITTGITQVRPLSKHEIAMWNKHINSYSRTDRTKRRQSMTATA